ncbi:MAG: hypothetical protein ISS56_20745 [Anaerolineae bacterium]|nr:hypothetical protein [Anaerolineae bacterium]
MRIRVASNMTPTEIHQAVAGFDRRYVEHWDTWLAAPASGRVIQLGAILRKWQAARPRTTRRPKAEAKHGPPFLEDLVAQAELHLALLGNIGLTTLHHLTPPQYDALCQLWEILGGVAVEKPASEVGITKAVLLLTRGRIGPALDSRVRAGLGIGRVRSPKEWVRLLIAIEADIRGFESAHGVSFRGAVPEEFRGLGWGRLYDMVLGPRER